MFSCMVVYFLSFETEYSVNGHSLYSLPHLGTRVDFGVCECDARADPFTLTLLQDSPRQQHLGAPRHPHCTPSPTLRVSKVVL